MSASDDSIPLASINDPTNGEDSEFTELLADDKSDIEEGGPPVEPIASKTHGGLLVVEIAKQLLLCVFLIGISVYEQIVKGRAVRDVRFDNATLVVMQAVASIVIGIGVASYMGTRRYLSQQWLRQLVYQAVPGVCFSIAAYVQLLALAYLSPDVFKVLGQTVLILLAALAYVIFQKRLSATSWISLVTITCACMNYTLVRTSEEAVHDFRTLLGNYHNNKEMDLRAMLTQHIEKHLDLSESSGVQIGLTFALIFVVLSAFGSTISEKVMKASDSPFYVQKVFMEITGLMTMLLLSAFQSRRVRSVLNWEAAAGNTKNMYDDGFFYGWSSAWVWITFVLVLVKSWLSGIIVKQLSALSKQLCTILAVAMLYFFVLVHSCEDDSFFCPTGLSKMSRACVAADFIVFLTVMSYTSSVRDKKRRGELKKTLADMESYGTMDGLSQQAPKV